MARCLFAEVDSEVGDKVVVPECVWVTASEGVDSWAGEDLGSNGFSPSA